MTVVSVHILDKDYETPRLGRQGPRGDQAMFGIYPVDPDNRVASVNLGVDRPTAGISIESTLLESEDVHEEPLGGLHVVVHSQRNDGLSSHARTSFLAYLRSGERNGFSSRR
jgi:hypothetical protein